MACGAPPWTSVSGRRNTGEGANSGGEAIWPKVSAGHWREVSELSYSSSCWRYFRNSAASSGRWSASSTDAFSQPIVVPAS